MGKKPNIKWLSEPQEHDYPAAEKYLTLTLELSAANFRLPAAC